ncbi:glutamyl-tRNA reductase [Luteimicrobium subarcticum]|uniref:Glutamyl-tRNA reductase n=1 Tax=Luteimicrobium subarcticum TaxID=620910 RepID=A0A2M8WRW1_9MICO|nr:glutamyl-tRNA reductase [Luteimicrobium subarcticum]
MVEADLVACDAISGAVVLATCNRFEVYVDVSRPGGTTDGTPSADPVDDLSGDGSALAREHASAEVARVVAASTGIDPDVARAALTVRTGDAVPHHLFSVAAGLDSMVVGEREIAGQVKRALEASRSGGTTTSALERLFQAASRTSKRVTNETALGAAGRSLVALGLDLASDDLPPWRQVRTVLIGTGSYAGASFAALHQRGAEDVRVFSRSGRAAAFAEQRGAVAVDDLLAALEDADLVVACSGGGRQGEGGGRTGGVAVQPALDAAAVLAARAQAARAVGDDAPTRPLVVLDLALTRDVAPQVGAVDGVLLYDLAFLQAHSPQLGSAVVAEASRIVEHATRHYVDGEGFRTADEVVVALVDAADREIAALVEQRVATARAAGVEVDVEEVELQARRQVRARLHRDILAVRSEAAAR